MTLSEINDYELVYLVEEGNEDAYNLIFEKYRPILDCYATQYYRIGKSVGVDYDDLYQEGLIGIHHAISSYRVSNQTILYTFILICVKGRMSNLIRRSSAKKHYILNNSLSLNYESEEVDCFENFIGVNDDPLDHLIYSQLQSVWIQFKHSIKFLHSQVLELRMNGFSPMEISRLLEISTKTVNNIIYINRRRFFEYLKFLQYV